MGYYEKFLGFGVVPFLMILLILLATGIMRRQIHYVVTLLLKFNFTVNGKTIYFFPLIGVINLIWIAILYIELADMHEPIEITAKTQYYEKLYRTYRNFLVNATSGVLIIQLIKCFYQQYHYLKKFIQIFLVARRYKEYAGIKDKLEEVKKLKKNQ